MHQRIFFFFLLFFTGKIKWSRRTATIKYIKALTKQVRVDPTTAMHQSFYQSNLTAERVTSLNLDILPLISSPDRVCVMLDVGRLHRTGHFRSRVKKKKKKKGDILGLVSADSRSRALGYINSWRSRSTAGERQLQGRD